MYLPYLRGKQFELEALLNVPTAVYANTLPILEPISSPKGGNSKRLYTNLASQNIPLILVMNPFYPQSYRFTTARVQQIVDNELATHPTLTLGFLIDQRFTIADFTAFLISNPNREKAVIFRTNPLAADLNAIQAATVTHPVQYVIFDDKRTSNVTRNAFNAHPDRILLTDGFQRQDRNSDYPPVSTFDSNYSTWGGNGWSGIGDYLSIGDHFQDGGGPAYVVTLHLSILSPTGILMHHFSSTSNSTVMGLAPQKFSEANDLLVNFPDVIPLTSSGLNLFRNWHTAGHYPGLGSPKQASLMHHIELLSSII